MCITFKSRADLSKLDANHPAYPVLDELITQLIDQFSHPRMPYSPDDFGYLVLLEEGDTDRVLDDIDMPCRLVDIPWEGASMRQGFIYAVWLGTDDYGMGFVIDPAFIHGELKEVMENILD